MEWEAQESHRPDKQKRGNKALAPLNQPKILMNLWRALMSVADVEFKLSKKALPGSSTSTYQDLGSYRKGVR